MGTPSTLLRVMYLSGRGNIRLNAATQVKRFGCLACTEHAPFRRYILTSPHAQQVSTSFGSKSLHISVQHNKCGDTTSTLPTRPAEKRLNLAHVLESSDAATEETVLQDFQLHEEFVSEEEADCLFEEVEDYLEDAEYEYDHWDNAIHGYRETEKSRWSEESQAILQRVRRTAFPSGEQQLSLVHVLDLAKDGYIKPHVDSVKFCGSTITGLSLLSTAIMRLARQDEPARWVQLVLRPRSLYVMKGRARYEFTHEILRDSESVFRGQKLARSRRLSIMCRNEPS